MLKTVLKLIFYSPKTQNIAQAKNLTACLYKNNASGFVAIKKQICYKPRLLK
jgi:hypothetical protein